MVFPITRDHPISSPLRWPYPSPSSPENIDLAPFIPGDTPMIVELITAPAAFFPTKRPTRKIIISVCY